MVLFSDLLAIGTVFEILIFLLAVYLWGGDGKTWTAVRIRFDLP